MNVRDAAPGIRRLHFGECQDDDVKSPVAPEEGRDWLLIASAAVLVAVFAGDVVVPGLALRPLVAAAERLADEEAPASALRTPGAPSVLWAAICVAAAVSVTAVAAAHLVASRKLGGPWLWLLVAGVTAALWSALTVVVVMRAHAATSAFVSPWR
ncbi:MAG: hypothetical protein H5T86_05485 [Armatimonadetes bacterium]|nr:hypothetical protein [Armatimonadota bacterium]